MNERPIDRLRIFAAYAKEKGIVSGFAAFESYCGLSNMYLNNMTKSKGNIGTDVICKVHEKFPELSILWLCTGDGDMIDKNAVARSEIEKALHSVRKICVILEDMLD